MSERAYQQDRLAQGLEPDPGLTKPGNERKVLFIGGPRWRVTWHRQSGQNPFGGLDHYSFYADSRAHAEAFAARFPAGHVTIEEV